MASPAAVVRQLFIDRTLGTAVNAAGEPAGAWPVYVSGEPNEPDEVITLYDREGFDQGDTQYDGEPQGLPGIQVRVRSQTHASGWDKADALRGLMTGLDVSDDVTVGSSVYRVRGFANIGRVLALGKESPNSKRNVFTINVLVEILRVS